MALLQVNILHLLFQGNSVQRSAYSVSVAAQVRLARMYVKVGDYEKADAAAAKLIESFSNAEGIAAAIEDVADKYQMAGSQDKSYPLHRYVVEHWPGDERAIWCQMKAANSRIAALDLAGAEAE
ncbi:MAG: hypothetical protein ACYTEQ_26020, partial [Planctomycetota bacterium]